MTAAERSLQDQSLAVQTASLKTITALAVRGDTHVIRIVASCLRHPEEEVRQEAILCLPRVAGTEFSKATQAVLPLLSDAESEVRSAAAAALPQVAARGHVEAMIALGGMLEDKVPEVRR
eukprot:1388182-Amphidinium_carterae.1